jgi:hypothetical protein
MTFKGTPNSLLSRVNRELGTRFGGEVFRRIVREDTDNPTSLLKLPPAARRTGGCRRAVLVASVQV